MLPPRSLRLSQQYRVEKILPGSWGFRCLLDDVTLGCHFQEAKNQCSGGVVLGHGAFTHLFVTCLPARGVDRQGPSSRGTYWGWENS